MESNGGAEASAIAARAAKALARFTEALRGNPYEGAAASLYVRGKALELVAEVLTGLLAPVSPDDEAIRTDRQRGHDARQLITNDLANPLRIEDVARQVGLSQRRLGEIFRELFGASPFQCLTQWRLEEGRALLARGDLSVKQVAHMMGYTHVSSFSYAYARHFGCPPSSAKGESS